MDESISIANTKLNTILSDEQQKEIIRMREKYLMDYNSDLDHSREEGRQEGLQKGLHEGLQKGRDETRKEAVLNLKETQFTAENIAKILKYPLSVVESYFNEESCQ